MESFKEIMQTVKILTVGATKEEKASLLNNLLKFHIKM